MGGVGGGSGNLAHIQSGKGANIITSCYRNRDKFWLNGPLRLGLNSNFSFFFTTLSFTFGSFSTASSKIEENKRRG